MNEGSVDLHRVIAVIQKDDPQVLQRAIMVVRIEDLEAENSRLLAALAEAHPEE